MARLIHDRISKDMESCIERCTDCHDACLELIDEHLRRGGRYAESDHIGLLEDCAEICRLAADFIVRRSPRHGLTCGICAEICEECSIDCESYGDDEVLLRCATIFRDCAGSCRAMSVRDFGSP